MIKAGEQYLRDIFTMKGCTVKIVIFYFFSRHDLTAPHTKFHVSQTPPSCFLLIYDPFLTNIWRKYFSCNHFTVLHQPKLKWSNLDQNWAKYQPLLFKISKISNCSLRLHSAMGIRAETSWPLHWNAKLGYRLQSQTPSLYGPVYASRTLVKCLLDRTQPCRW